MIITDEIQFGYSDTEHPDPSEFPSHMHLDYEILLVYEGDLDYVVGDSAYKLNAGDVLLIKPTVYHFAKINSPAPYKRAVINFAPSVIGENLAARLERVPARGNVNKLAPLLHAVETMREAESFPTPDAVAVITDLIKVMALYLANAPDESYPASPSVHPALARVLKYIDDSIGEKITVGSLAEKFFVSRSWLTHAFDEYLHIGIMQYVNNKKILRARQLISDGMPAARAADECGFGNYPTFYRLYKRTFGSCPTSSGANRRNAPSRSAPT